MNNLTPTKNFEDNWIWSMPKESGKWLIFVKVAKIDHWWEQIHQATQEGRLGIYSRVSTQRRFEAYRSKDRSYLICVYTQNAQDKEDVYRVRRALWDMGIKWKCKYKSMEDSLAGISRALYIR